MLERGKGGCHPRMALTTSVMAVHTSATETWADWERVHAFCTRTNTKKDIQQSSPFAEWDLISGTLMAGLQRTF